MSRGTTYGQRRAVALWVGGTGCTAAAWTLAGPSAARVTAPSRAATFAELLEPVCAAALLGALTWLWVLVTLAVASVLRGRAADAGAGAVRRLVLLACGMAVVAGSSLPAHAAGREGAELLAGLPLPERAVAPALAEPRPPGARDATHVVRPGDSLWSIARAHPAPGTGVEARWRQIWRHNRHVVGDDPDLIHPGQALRLPGTHTHTGTHEDGERR